MPFSETFACLIVALLLAGIIALAWPATRRYLVRRSAWATIVAGGLLLSAASWFISEERIGGTLLQRSHGWPKPYSGECLSPECPEQGPGINLLYFLGNSFVYVAGLLLLWTLISILLTLRDSRRSAQ